MNSFRILAVFFLFWGWVSAPVAQAQSLDYRLFSAQNPADTLQSGQIAAQEEPASWIVLFRQQPSKSAQLQAQQFHADLMQLQAKYLSPSKISADPVGYIYAHLLTGASFVAPSHFIPEILQWDYVASVHPDLPVETHFLPGNTPQITLKETSQYRGKGVRVAVVDTGVDYSHTDLGGGFGAGFKVIGGYDFVDHDADPMDLNGHGTHVAGIIAGEGLSPGMVPEAEILAYRVLNEYGSGDASAVIAGIERAVADGAHIINLSLGTSSGDATHPLSLAVDAASQNGVIIVASAGNTGPFFGTIGAPAAARTAITVAAEHEKGVLAKFSSRGPARPGHQIKPDISAPGVDIVSAVPGGHRALSGTSMAAPYVAGLAARLREKHPDLAWWQIRSLLVQSASKDNLSLWKTGYGSASPEGAEKISFGIHPTSVNIPPPENGRLSFSDTLQIFNSGSESQTFDIRTESQPGIRARTGVRRLVLQPGEISRLPVIIEADYDALPYASALPPVYLGDIIFSSTTDTISVPFGVPKASQLHFKIDASPDLVIIHDRNLDYTVLSRPGNETIVELGAKTYDILAVRAADGTKWIHEDIAVHGIATVDLTEIVAKNTVRFALSDPEGKPVGVCTFSRETLLHETSGLSLEYQYLRPCPIVPDTQATFRMSDFSKNYRYEVAHLSYGEHSGYEYLRYPFVISEGLERDVNFSAGGSDFLPVLWKYSPPPGASELSFTRYFESGSSRLFRPPSWQRLLFRDPWERKDWIMPNPDARFATNFATFDMLHALEGSSYEPDYDTLSVISPQFYTHRRDSITLKTPGMPDSTALTLPFPKNALEPATGLPGWQPGKMVLRDGILSIPQKNAWFSGWIRELIPVKTDITVMQQGDVLRTETGLNTIPVSASVERQTGFSIPLLRGPVQLELQAQGWHLGNRATQLFVNVDFEADSGLPHCLDRWAFVNSDGKSGRIWQEHETPELHIYLTLGCHAVPEVLAQHTASEKQLWLRATQTNRNGAHHYIYAWPDKPERGLWNVQLTLKDSSGSSKVSLSIEPAIRFGVPDASEPPDSPRILSPKVRSYVQVPEPEFSWSPVDQAVRYQFQLAEDAGFTTIHTDSTLSGSSVSVPAEGYGTNWFWRVRAINAADITGPWSLRGSFTSLTIPTHIDNEPELPTAFYLGQNYPNPFNPSTRIPFGIRRPGNVLLEVFDINGRIVRSQNLGILHAGVHEVHLDARNFAGGVYLYRISSSEGQLTRKMVLLK